jgi:NADH-quinone oxidoreductase subunit L
MAAGCVIHLAGGENDLYRMGGLARRGPRELFWIFLVGALCLAGAPLTGGFFSKDGIMLAAYTQGTPLFLALWGVAVLTTLLTAVYTFRLVYLVFAGAPRSDHHPHPLPLLTRWPLWPLALLGLSGGLLNLPPLVGGSAWLHRHLGALAGRASSANHDLEWALAGLASGLVVLGWGIARWRYGRFRGAQETFGHRVLLGGWGADTLVDALLIRPFATLSRFCAIGCDRALVEATVDGIARQTTACGERLRLLTTGRISTYLAAFLWGFLIMLGWFLLALVR